MGQKINPIGFRLAIRKKWYANWYANNKNFAFFLNQDIKIRILIRKSFKNAFIGFINIERNFVKNIKIIIFCSRPGILIGKAGEGIENLKKSLYNLTKSLIEIEIKEICNPEINSLMISESIAKQLEKRIMFRRIMKRAIQNAMRFGIIGIKIMLSGRLNGIEIARKEWYSEGRVPLHTLRANIDYSFSEAKTSYGIIGVKVWLCFSNVLIKKK